MSSQPSPSAYKITWWDRCSALGTLAYMFSKAALPTLGAIFTSPSLLWRPKMLRAVFFENVWECAADGVDEAGRDVKLDLLPRARGVVLELGAGHGHNCKYLDMQTVTRYIALEPNPFMHDKIIMNATKAGFQPSQVQVIKCGAEDTDRIVKELAGEQVDTIISILSFCGVPDAKGSLERMADRVLKPGGMFLFYEHVRCTISPTLVWWQSVWTQLLWGPILGCSLDKPTHIYVEELDVWETRKRWDKEGETPNLFWHQAGYYVKRS